MLVKYSIDEQYWSEALSIEEIKHCKFPHSPLPKLIYHSRDLQTILKHHFGPAFPEINKLCTQNSCQHPGQVSGQICWNHPIVCTILAFHL